MNAPIKKFAWSWTRLKNWRSCPKRHYHLEIAKDIIEVESEQLKWGHTFHEAMAERVSKGRELPKDMARYDRWPAMMHQHKLAGAKVYVELRLAIDERMQPTGWFDPDTWFRGVIDVLYLGDYGVAVDWKTGQKIEPEAEQLALNAQLIFSHHPEIETVHTAYQWAAHNRETINTYMRRDMVPLWAKLLPEVKRMEAAAINMNYPPRPSGLCLKWCPVTHCPHHGRRTY